MKPIQLAKDVVPLAEFKSRLSQWLDTLRATGNPIVLTQNGRPAAVLLSPSEYDRLSERHRFLEAVREGIADADAGRVMETDELRRRLEERRKTR